MATATPEREPLRTIIEFVESIGISTESTPIEEPTFLPGVKIVRGSLHYDESRLSFPGDLLHEAGHIAVMTPEDRAEKVGDLGNDPACEMAAIAWSWAALTHLELPPEVVFHSEGYHGGSDSIIENFSAGRYFGVPYLQWIGLTTEPLLSGAEGACFPRMNSWIRE